MFTMINQAASHDEELPLLVVARHTLISASPFVLKNENKKHPEITMMPPTPCSHVICSPMRKNARIEVKIGLKFRKIPDVVAPSFCTPVFQSTMHTTVEITPVYKREPTKGALMLVTVKSVRLKGRRITSPKMAEYKMDISGVVLLMAHLLHTE